MADFNVTTTAQNGTGSITKALEQIENGETITFDDSLIEGGVITILFESQITLPPKQFTIEGGEHTGSGETLQTRVVFDGQGATQLLLSNNTNNNVTLNNITFYNTYSASQAGTVFRNCDNSVFNNCVVDTANRAAFFISRTDETTVFNNCLIKNCNSDSSGGALYTYNQPEVILNNCVFKNNTATNGATLYQSGGASGGAIVTFNNCIIGDTTSASNFYINTSTERSAIIFTTPTHVDKITYMQNMKTAINGFLTVDVFKANNGSTVTFDGVDSVIAVTTEFGGASATYAATSGSTGYLAIPSGATAPTVGEGVHVATYSTATPTISATITNRDASVDIKNAGSGYITEVEYADGTVDDLTITEGAAEIAVDKAFKIRLFNGAFYYSPFVPRTYYLKTYDVDGDFATAADWTLDAQKTLTCNAAPTIQNGTFYCTAPEV